MVPEDDKAQPCKHTEQPFQAPGISWKKKNHPQFEWFPRNMMAFCQYGNALINICLISTPSEPPEGDSPANAQFNTVEEILWERL